VTALPFDYWVSGRIAMAVMAVPLLADAGRTQSRALATPPTFERLSIGSVISVRDDF
jgi:hypothetical protein